MANLEKEYDVAVIDEIQLLADSERGWAWTRALLGLPVMVYLRNSALKHASVTCRLFAG